MKIEKSSIFYLHHSQEPVPKDPKGLLLPVPWSLFTSLPKGPIPTTADATQDHSHLSFSLLVAESLDHSSLFTLIHRIQDSKDGGDHEVKDITASAGWPTLFLRLSACSRTTTELVEWIKGTRPNNIQGTGMSWRVTSPNSVADPSKKATDVKCTHLALSKN